jgi:hypothetical protein
VNRPWIVRTVALLLVLVGLQAGAFSDLDRGDERYYGTEDYSAVVRPEARKPDAIPLPLPAAQPPRALQAALFPASLAPARRLTVARAFTPHHLPDPTGPPRA